MHRKLAILPLAVLCLSLGEEPPAGPDYIAGAVFPGGWPQGAQGDVLKMVGGHIVNPLQGDLVALIGTQGEPSTAYMSLNPEQHLVFIEVADAVADMELLPLGDGTDGVLTVGDSGLALNTWSSNPQDPFAGYFLEKLRTRASH